MEYARVLIIDVFLLKLLILRLHNPLHVRDIYLFKCCSYKRELSSTVFLRRTHAGQQIMTSLKLTSPSSKTVRFRDNHNAQHSSQNTNLLSHLACCNQVVQSLIYEFECRCYPLLPRYNESQQWNLPIRKNSYGSVFSFPHCYIHSLPTETQV